MGLVPTAVATVVAFFTGYLVIIAFLAIVANIVADIIYALLDPRIRINA